jgi:uncharacterized protein (TIGR00369 family)
MDETADGDLRAAAVRRAANQGFVRLLGATLEEVVPGRCVASLDLRPDLMQMNGFFHGGVLAFLCDYATAVAASTMLRDRARESVLTAEFKLNMLSPATGPRLICRAEVVRPGRTLTVVEARLFNAGGAAEKLVAIGLASIAVVARAGLPFVGDAAPDSSPH